LAVLPVLHALSHVRAGWGLESLFATFAEAACGRPIRTFILDAVGAEHMRPVSTGSPLHQIGRDELFLLSLYKRLPPMELARFTDPGDAARFAFPLLEEDSNAAAARMKNVRNARLVYDLVRKGSLRGRLLRRLIPDAEFQ
jgi:hypothetical protein